MNIQPESIEEKQEFLRNEVLFKGYDPNEFLKFLESKKGEGAADLERWTLDELNAVIQLFKTMHQPKREVSEELREEEANTEQTQIEGEDSDTAKSEREKASEFIKCNKSPKTELSHSDFYISVSKFSLKQA